MSCRLLTLGAAMAALAFPISNTSAQAPKLDYEFFKSRVQPIFLTKRPGHARCYVCHVESNNAFQLEKLSPDAREWTEQQSRRNFETVSKLVNPGDPGTSRLLQHPLGPEGGGDVFHSGGRQFPSKRDPGLADSRRLGHWSDARCPGEVAAPCGGSTMFSVFIRLGTSPTGITATSFINLVSMAETERNPALET